MATSRTTQQKHPFLFFGHSPGDWAEGPQLWFIRFAKLISEKNRGKLGRPE